MTASDVLRITNFTGKIVNGTGGLSFTYNSIANSYSAILTST